ncbi:MAG: nucleolar RNA-binding Nop10p family protein [Nitrososphaerota archaeon]
MTSGKILRCSVCRTYTLKKICPKCGSETETAHPPAVSAESPYTQLLIKVRRLKKWPPKDMQNTFKPPHT